MPGPQWQRAPSVAKRLLTEPYRFDFFQAVRVMEQWLKAQGYSGDQALAEHIRFENSTTLSFPPSDIESLRVQAPAHDDEADAQPPSAEDADAVHIQRFYMTPSFMGFLGPNGTLPRHYSERISTHQLYARDSGPRAFLDTYSNRVVALFYSAWKKYRLHLDHETSGYNGFMPLLLALGGIGIDAQRERLDLSEQGIHPPTLAYYTATLRQRPMSGTYLQHILREHFAVPVQVQQFVGNWYHLPASNQTRLGAANATLGSTALCGSRVWQRDLRITVQLGPLRKPQFESFLPGEHAAVALEHFLKMLVGTTLEYEIQPVLHEDDVQPCTLADQRANGRLGLDTFLCTQPQKGHRFDVRYSVNTLTIQ